jgi:hypothetical protein
MVVLYSYLNFDINGSGQDQTQRTLDESLCANP